MRLLATSTESPLLAPNCKAMGACQPDPTGEGTAGTQGHPEEEEEQGHTHSLPLGKPLPPPPPSLPSPTVHSNRKAAGRTGPWPCVQLLGRNRPSSLLVSDAGLSGSEKQNSPQGHTTPHPPARELKRRTPPSAGGDRAAATRQDCEMTGPPEKGWQSTKQNTRRPTSRNSIPGYPPRRTVQDGSVISVTQSSSHWPHTGRGLGPAPDVCSTKLPC